MKTLLHIPGPTTPKITFPILAQQNKDGYVVLFTKEEEGIVLDGKRTYNIGHYADNWLSIYNSDAWTILPVGTSFTITQE